MDIILNIKYGFQKLSISSTNFFNMEKRGEELAKLNTDYAMCKLFKEMQANQEYFNGNASGGVVISDRTFTNLTNSLKSELKFEISDVSDHIKSIQALLKSFAEGNEGRYLGMGAFNGPSKTSPKDHQTIFAIRDLINAEMPIRLEVMGLSEAVKSGNLSQVINKIYDTNSLVMKSVEIPKGVYFPGEKSPKVRISEAEVFLQMGGADRMFNALLNSYEKTLQEQINSASDLSGMPDSEEMIALNALIAAQEEIMNESKKNNNFISSTLETNRTTLNKKESDLAEKKSNLIRSLYKLLNNKEPGIAEMTFPDMLPDLKNSLEKNSTNLNASLTSLRVVPSFETEGMSKAITAAIEETTVKINSIQIQLKTISDLNKELSELNTEKSNSKKEESDAKGAITLGEKTIDASRCTITEHRKAHAAASTRNVEGYKETQAVSVQSQKGLLAFLQRKPVQEEVLFERQNSQELDNAVTMPSQTNTAKELPHVLARRRIAVSAIETTEAPTVTSPVTKLPEEFSAPKPTKENVV